MTLDLFSQSSQMGPWTGLHEGSPSEKKLIDQLQIFSEQEKIPYRIRTYEDEELLHSFGRSLEIYRNRDGENQLVIVFPLKDTIFGSNYKISFIFDLIKGIDQNSGNSDYTFLFLTGEEREIPVGSTMFLDDYRIQPERTGVLYLDLSGNFSDFDLVSGSKGNVSPLWFTKDVEEQLSAQGINTRWNSTDLQIQRTGFSRETPYITPYLQNNIASVLLRSRRIEEEINLSNSYDSLLKGLINLYSNFENLDPELTDSNYFYFSFQNKDFFIDESTYLLIYLGFFSIILFLILIQYRKVVLNLRKFRNQLWMILLSFMLILTLLMLSTLLMEELSYLFNDPLIWLSVPLPAFLFKITLTFIFASFFLFMLRGLPIPRSPHFYSYNAYFIAFVNLLVLSLLEITLTYFWIWTLLFTILFTQSRKLFIKILALLLIPIPFIIAFISVVQGDFPALQSFLISSRLSGNLFLALNLLPFTLMLTSLHYYRYYYLKERNSLVGLFTLITTTLIALSLFIFFTVSHNRILTENRQITVREDISMSIGKRTLTLNSGRDMGNIQIQWNDKIINLQNLGKTAEIEQGPPQDWLNYTKKESLFLDRQYITMEITPKGNPDFCNLTLVSEESFTIFACNYPYEMNANGTRAELLIGQFPPIPIPLEITLNRVAAPELNCQFIYKNWPDHVDIKEIPFITEQLIFQDNLDL